MHPQLESVFDEAENRYLNSNELGVLSQYVSSLPERLDLYRVLRDREVEVMQSVADNLMTVLPNQKPAALERSIKNALLVLRYCAMAMLLEDVSFVEDRIRGWLKESMQAHNTLTIDNKLYQLLDQQLAKTLNPQQLALLQPMLTLAQNSLLGSEEPLTAAALEW